MKTKPHLLAFTWLASIFLPIGFVGFDGGQLIALCDHVVYVNTECGQYGLVEDAHLAISHIIFHILMDYLKEEKN